MHTRGHLKETIFLCGIFLLFSSKTAGQTCRGQCGDVLEKCSCHATCVSLLKCCADYNQSCFQVTPHSSSMLGGRALRILGVALHPGGRLLCRFKGEIEREGFIDDEGHGYCISPLLYETGWIPFTVSIDGIHFDRSGEFLSVHPSKADPAFEVILVNATQWQYYGTPNVSGRLKMTWNSSLIGAETVNLELWGYREFSRSTESGVNGSSSLQAELSYLYSLGRNLPNTGAFSFVPEPSEDYSDWKLGNIRITASSKSDGARDVEGLWSGGHVLAWHLEQAFRDESAAWARSRCLQWDVLENKLPNFLEELITCPCTLAQARADTGRFHTDYSCDIERGSVCTYHPGSVHCVRAIQASPTHGSGQQCCYDSTGALVLTGDSIGGSTPDRAHDWGSPPYREPPRVPGYSHWLYDVMSFYYCCLWSDHCNIYFNHRPSSGCRSYQPPKAGVVLGDPHFVTFDGLGYTFNGKGEYYLVSSPDRELSVQARTEALKFKNGTSAKATVLSSVAMKGNTSDVIEVRLADGHLQVLRNQKVLPFTEQRWMDLHGIFVFTPSLQNVTVIFLSGVGVEVRVREGAMAVTVLLPSEFTNHTQGLLGLMNSDPSDDLLTGLGEILSPADATPEEIFTFGAGWNISKTSSLFTYDSKYLMDTYYFPPSHDTAFVPAFSLPETPDDPLMADMLAMCLGEGAQFCKYDTLTTQSLRMGNATLGAYQSHLALTEALEQVVSCGWLPTPRNGKKNGTHYLEGSCLSFTCDEGFSLYGSTERTCLDDGSWTGEQPYCITGTRNPLLDPGHPFPPPYVPPPNAPAHQQQGLADAARKESLRQQKGQHGEEEEEEEEGPDSTVQQAFPMIQTMGPEGPAVVYRPWTMKEMLEHLPEIQQDGDKFAKALLLFCQQFSPTMPEIKKLLTLKIGPTHASHFTALLAGQLCLKKPEWDHNDNAPYRDAITALGEAIGNKFPAKVDMSKISACKQTAEETVNDYYHRLH